MHFLECGGSTPLSVWEGRSLHEPIEPAAEEIEQAEVAEDFELPDFVAGEESPPAFKRRRHLPRLTYNVLRSMLGV